MTVPPPDFKTTTTLSRGAVEIELGDGDDGIIEVEVDVDAGAGAATTSVVVVCVRESVKVVGSTDTTGAAGESVSMPGDDSDAMADNSAAFLAFILFISRCNLLSTTAVSVGEDGSGDGLSLRVRVMMPVISSRSLST